MKSPRNDLIESMKAANSVRCQVCHTRVKRSKDSPSGFACPRCGRDYNPEYVKEDDPIFAKPKDTVNPVSE